MLVLGDEDLRLVEKGKAKPSDDKLSANTKVIYSDFVLDFV